MTNPSRAWKAGLSDEVTCWRFGDWDESLPVTTFPALNVGWRVPREVVRSVHAWRYSLRLIAWRAVRISSADFEPRRACFPRTSFVHWGWPVGVRAAIVRSPSATAAAVHDLK